jgi:hypothetical protein
VTWKNSPVHFGAHIFVLKWVRECEVPAIWHFDHPQILSAGSSKLTALRLGLSALIAAPRIPETLETFIHSVAPDRK